MVICSHRTLSFKILVFTSYTVIYDISLACNIVCIYYAALLPRSLKIRCSSSFTVAPGNMGRPVAISYRIQPTPLEEKGGDEELTQHFETLCEALFSKHTLQRVLMMSANMVGVSGHSAAFCSIQDGVMKRHPVVS